MAASQTLFLCDGAGALPCQTDCGAVGKRSDSEPVRVLSVLSVPAEGHPDEAIGANDTIGEAPLSLNYLALPGDGGIVDLIVLLDADWEELAGLDLRHIIRQSPSLASILWGQVGERLRPPPKTHCYFNILNR
jgi:hypothetical protein